MKVGILGATGAVGRQMLECLEERKIQIDELKLFASQKSEGRTFSYQNQMIACQIPTRQAFADLDFILGAVEDDLSRQYVELMDLQKTIYIDNSKAYRLEKNVPLVIPEINHEDLKHHQGIIANPNCSTIIAYMALYPLFQLAGIQAIQACTYQAVSGAGILGIQELNQEIMALQHGQSITPKVFSQQIAYNAIAQIGDFNNDGWTSEELKMLYEGRKIMHDDTLEVSCTCVRIPVYRSHSISLRVKVKNPVSLEDVKKTYLQQHPGLFYDELVSPLMTSNQDLVGVSRIRQDMFDPDVFYLWCCGDQIRKGAASNAVQILEYFLKKC